MKILGTARPGHFIVEMSSNEIANFGGWYGSTSMGKEMKIEAGLELSGSSIYADARHALTAFKEISDALNNVIKVNERLVSMMKKSPHITQESTK